MKIIEQDILKIEDGIVCHQVNCQGVMGAGIAHQIKEFRKQVFVQYRNFCEEMQFDPKKLLGKTQFVEYGPLIIVNMFCQEKFGRKKKYPYTDYDAVKRAFEELKKKIFAYGYEKKQVYIPYMMGCGLAGGDWEVYSKIVKDILPTTIACKLPNERV